LNAQTPKRRVGEYHGANGKPTWAATGVNDLAIDYVNEQVWEYYTKSTTIAVTDRWRVVTDTITTNAYFGIKGDKGDKGDRGTDGVCPSCPPTSGGWNASMFPFIIVVPNGVDDTQQLQRALDSSRVTMKSIPLFGTYKMSSGLIVAREHTFLNITGHARLVAINSNKWTFISSPLPPNNGDAEGAYTNRRINISMLHFYGMNNAQSGINLQSSLGIEISHCYGWGLNTFIEMPFGLRGKIDMCEANGCRVGFVITSGVNRWQGAGSSTSCSNGAIFTNNRVYCQSWTDTAVIMVDASHLQMRNNVIEGHSAKVGLYYNSTSPTADGANLYDWHFELINGTTDAQLIIRSSTRTHILDRVYFYTNPAWTTMKGWHLKLEGGGYKQIDFVNYSSGKSYDGSKGASIAHDAGTNYNFINCDDPLRNQTTVKSLFNANINYSCGTTAGTRGANTFCFQNPINR
jgi:hypothetical protein